MYPKQIDTFSHRTLLRSLRTL